MKKLFLFISFILLFMISKAQKKYSLGVNGVLYTTNTKNQAKKDLFLYNVIGAKLEFRKNVNNNNFLTISAESVLGEKNIYSYQSIRFGYEVGGIFNLKNLFLITDIGIGRFSSKILNKSSIVLAPSIGTAYNIYISKNIFLRPYNNVILNIPNKVIGVFGNFGLGLHYCFDKNKTTNK